MQIILINAPHALCAGDNIYTPGVPDAPIVVTLEQAEERGAALNGNRSIAALAGGVMQYVLLASWSKHRHCCSLRHDEWCMCCISCPLRYRDLKITKIGEGYVLKFTLDIPARLTDGITPLRVTTLSAPFTITDQEPTKLV